MKTLYIIVILTLASLSLMGDDLTKFLLSAHSATANYVLIRHHAFTTLGIALIGVIFISLCKQKKWNISLFGAFLILVILSLRTFALDISSENITVISGFSIVQTSECNCIESNCCDIKIGFFLEDEVKKVIKSNQTKR